MQEQLVSLQTARLAKDKDFDWKVNQMYRQGVLTEKTSLMYDWNSQNCIDFISAPTQSLLQHWLREVHKINSRVASNSINYHFPMNGILSDDGELMRGPSPMKVFKTYEEALELGLLEALKLIK